MCHENCVQDFHFVLYLNPYFVLAKSWRKMSTIVLLPHPCFHVYQAPESVMMNQKVHYFHDLCLSSTASKRCHGSHAIAICAMQTANCNGYMQFRISSLGRKFVDLSMVLRVLTCFKNKVRRNLQNQGKAVKTLENCQLRQKQPISDSFILLSEYKLNEIF